MTPGKFIDRWRANTRNEAAASKAHFLDLCELLDVPKPQEDATGAAYAFEKGADKAGGRRGFADVWKRECFGWEYKRKGGNLGEAHIQLLRYAGALGNPPLLVVSDTSRIEVHTAWTNEVSKSHHFELEQLEDAATRDRLADMWQPPPVSWKSGTSRQALTEKAAGEFAQLASRLRSRGHDAFAVAHFMVRLAFCFFAADIKLLPHELLEKMLNRGRQNPERFDQYAGRLFAAMAKRGGEIDFTPIRWFNGGLFDDASALPLEKGDAELLQRAAALDWRDIDPSIMGTLFERGLDPDKRGQLGAHYTDRDTIWRIVSPTVVQPLEAEWEAAHEAIARTMAKRNAIGPAAVGDAALAALEGDRITAESLAARKTISRSAETRRKRSSALKVEAEGILSRFLERLRTFRVLDPACGSGNFLYVALLALKDLERKALVEAEALGLPARFPEVGPEVVLGIELNAYAAELARVSVWIGQLQWARRNGYSPPENPVLRRLDNIECRDAVLALDGQGKPSPAAWPSADVIIGNPPFLGGKMLRRQLGNATVDKLFAAYTGRVPAEADLVTYWFDKARQAVEEGRTRRVGLVATNSIRGGANREVLDRAARAAPIFKAWADEPWVLDGAAVRVSLVCMGRDVVERPRLNDREVDAIFTDLTAGDADLTRAVRLSENARVCFMGTTKVGSFDVPAETARAWLLEPPNANGGTNADVVRPWRNGLHILRRADDAWVVDFGATMGSNEAAFYSEPFAYVSRMVRPEREKQRRDGYRLAWWRHGEARAGMRNALNGLSRYIATPRVAKHRIFTWLDNMVVPDCQLIVTTRDDDTTFGVLHSRFHEAWALRMGSSLEDRPRYTPTTTFEAFPFPIGLTPKVPAVVYACDPRAVRIADAARKLVAARDRWLNPDGLVERVREVVPGFPDRVLPRSPEAAAQLRKRTLTALYNTRGKPEGTWLDGLHAQLDAAVAEAYGWPADISEADALAALLRLNQERARHPAAVH
ncbi:DNA methyltransferase [Pararoseomonas sp. SCSIO 73927]|uniref:class I SAM-dependent DNA methyltransferase n=1 Tax=Pararoseomonas sp. SCSIO 73927 TaxID=3114537 RepID=UPI0030CF3444